MAQSYSARLAGGGTASSSITGVSGYAGDTRIEIRLKNCPPPNDGVARDILRVTGQFFLRFPATANRIEMGWPGNTSGNSAPILDTTGWGSDYDLRLSSFAGLREAMEKWDGTGGGYQSSGRPISATAAATPSTVTVGSSGIGLTGSGCEIAYVRYYQLTVPEGSAPPSTATSPATGARRAWECNEGTGSICADVSANGGANMTFSSGPTWVAEDTSLACWMGAPGAVAGQPITLNTYERGTATSRVWRMTSQPSLNSARLSSYSAASPKLISAVSGNYAFSLNIGDGSNTNSCSSNLTVAAPAAGNGGYLKYLMNVKFAAMTGTSTVKIDLMKPTGAHVVGSPYYCSASPCEIYADDTGMGEYLYRLTRLNSSGAAISQGDWTPLKTSLVSVVVPKGPNAGTQSPLYPHWRIGGVMYTGTTENSSVFAQEWKGKNFDLVIGGSGDIASPLVQNPTATWTTYYDFTGCYMDECYWHLRDHAVANSWPYEDYMLHNLGADFQPALASLWTLPGKFGWDGEGTGLVKHGVITFNAAGSSAWVDDSADAWNTTTGDVAIGTGGTMYVGFPEPFDLINIEVGTARSSGSATWQYWNGSTWTSLSASDNQSGNTLGLTATGQITFTPPATWTPVTYTPNVGFANGSRNRFYVRCVVASASTGPVLSRVYGDNWVTYKSAINVSNITQSGSTVTVTTSADHGFIAGSLGNIVDFSGGAGDWTRLQSDPYGDGPWAVSSTPTSTTFTFTAPSGMDVTTFTGTMPSQVRLPFSRGWAPTSPTTCCNSAFEYDSTPPTASTARFRYQGRVRSFFGASRDQLLGNMTSGYNVGSNLRYWPRFAAEEVGHLLDAKPEYNAVIWDNADALIDNIRAYGSVTKNGVRGGFDWRQPYTWLLEKNELAAAHEQSTAWLNANYPTKKICGNVASKTAAVAYQLDCAYSEHFFSVGEAKDPAPATTQEGVELMSFDGCADTGPGGENEHGGTCYIEIWNLVDPDVEDLGLRTVTAITAAADAQITTSTAHGYAVGEVVEMIGGTGSYATLGNVTVKSVVNTTQFTIENDSTAFTGSPSGMTSRYVVGKHTWFDKGNRRAVLGVANWLTMWSGSPNVAMNYNAANSSYGVDDLTYNMGGDAKLVAPLTANSSSTGGAAQIQVDDMTYSWEPDTPEMYLIIGDPPNADYVKVATGGRNLGTNTYTITSNSYIFHNYPVGTPVRLRMQGHASYQPIPASRLLWRMNYVPVMSVDIGTPVSGTRNMDWKTPAEYGGLSGSLNYRMQEYTNGIAIVRPSPGTYRPDFLNNCPSTAISLPDTYYRVHEDGGTESTPYTSIKLREGEGFIGRKSPTFPTKVPAWQQNTCP